MTFHVLRTKLTFGHVKGAIIHGKLDLIAEHVIMEPTAHIVVANNQLKGKMILLHFSPYLLMNGIIHEMKKSHTNTLQLLVKRYGGKGNATMNGKIALHIEPDEIQAVLFVTTKLEHRFLNKLYFIM